MMGCAAKCNSPCNNRRPDVGNQDEVSASLSLKLRAETNTPGTLCGVACEWQHLPLSKLQQTLQTPLCNPVGMTTPHQRH